jgi:hypothetical protein
VEKLVKRTLFFLNDAIVEVIAAQQIFQGQQALVAWVDYKRVLHCPSRLRNIPYLPASHPTRQALSNQPVLVRNEERNPPTGVGLLVVAASSSEQYQRQCNFFCHVMRSIG